MTEFCVIIPAESDEEDDVVLSRHGSLDAATEWIKNNPPPPGERRTVAVHSSYEFRVSNPRRHFTMRPQ